MGDDGKHKGQNEDVGWQYKSDAAMAEMPDQHTDVSPGRDGPQEDSVEWTASEFVTHEKGFGWYAILVCVAALVAAGVYLITKDAFSVTVLLIMAVIFGIAASRKPRVVTYRIDSSGLTIGNKFYPYAAHKSFAMAQEGPFTTIVLTPLKHFAFPVGAYLAPESRDKVLEILSDHLPLERKEAGAIDHLMHRLRF